MWNICRLVWWLLSSLVDNNDDGDSDSDNDDDDNNGNDDSCGGDDDDDDDDDDDEPQVCYESNSLVYPHCPYAALWWLYPVLWERKLTFLPECT